MSTETFEIEAEIRNDLGKGASRRLRHAGVVPVIMYGGGEDPQSLQMQHKDLAHHLENEAFYSHILKMTVNGKMNRVVLKDLQRHPSKPTIVHADFLRVSLTDVIRMQVPLHFLNEEECVGVKLNGGLISHNMTDVEISCAAQDLPEYIELDLAALDIGDAIHLSELKLPEGVEVVALMHGHGEEADAAVVTVNKKAAVEEEDEGAPEAPEAPESDVKEGGEEG